MCPVPRTEALPASYSTWLARISRSPWRISTLPLSVAFPSTPSVALSLVTSMLPLSARAFPCRAPAAGDASAGVAASGGAVGCPFCDGQGGSSAQAAGMMPPSRTIAIRSGLERIMKGGIIMARRSQADPKTHNSHMLETDARVALIEEWLSRELRLPGVRVEPASSDASFRRYFRVFHDGGTYVLMDAPPGKEDVRPYLKVSAL